MVDENVAIEYLKKLDERYGNNDLSPEEFANKKIQEVDGKKVLRTNDEVLGVKRGFSFESKLGWMPIHIEDLPTQGMFYPEDIKIDIRSASVEEIKHWSTLDTTDFLQINEYLNYILKSCASISNKKTKMVYNWDDIIEIDRLYVIFRISELTFPDKNNKLVMNIKCKGDKGNSKTPIFVTSDKLYLLDIDPELYKIYDSKERCFVKTTKDGKEIRFYFPKVSVATAIKEYMMVKRREGEDVDAFVAKILPYMVNDASLINDDYIVKLNQDMSEWTKNKILYVNGIVDLINKSSKMVVRYKCEKDDVAQEVPLFFRGEPNIKNLFSISDGLDDLV